MSWQAAGRNDFKEMSSNSIFRPLSRARIKILRITSMPLRSMRGSGSV